LNQPVLVDRLMIPGDDLPAGPHRHDGISKKAPVLNQPVLVDRLMIPGDDLPAGPHRHD